MRGRPRLFGPMSVVAVAAIVLALGGCATVSTATPVLTSSPSPAATPIPSPSPSPLPTPSPSPVPDSPVDGVVIDVDAQGLTEVDSFTIRTDDGAILVFRVGQLEAGSLPVGHLTEHAATGVPVRVTFFAKDGELEMVSYVDAD